MAPSRHGGRTTRNRIRLKEQATRIEQLFVVADAEPTVEEAREQNREVPLLALPNEILLKIIGYVGGYEENSGKRNDAVKRMLDVRLVCSRLYGIVSEGKGALPKYAITNMRIKFHDERRNGTTVFVYRYGNGEHQKPCVFSLLEKVPKVLSCHEIFGKVIIDGFVIDDALLSTLNHLKWTNVTNFCFANVRGVSLQDTTHMFTLMGHLSRVEHFRLFGYYEEEELFTEEDAMLFFKRLLDNFDGLKTDEQIEVFAEELRFKKDIMEARWVLKRRAIERSKRRTSSSSSH